MAAPRVHTIAPGVPFADALAAGVLERTEGDPLLLSRVTLLLPTRRACRALRDSFLRLSDLLYAGRPLLLPRMMTLGDVDEDELVLLGDEGDLDIPPAIPGLRRQLQLTRLILARGGDETPDQAARLAAALARLLDQAGTEGLSLDGLKVLVPDEYAEHWKLTLDFLNILTEMWPRHLEEEGCLDSADRRNRLMRAQAEAWRRAPPGLPVIAAGSTGSIPATAELLAVVANLSQGCVVLPGLDRAMDPASRAALEPTHPQYGLDLLLQKLGVTAEDVSDWPYPLDLVPTRSPLSRASLIAEAMRPAATADAWRDAGPIDAAALDGLSLLDCPGPQEEAGAVALLMRQALETPGRTAALVTPDRALARRVAGELRRWDIEIDDSAGRPLAETPPGIFLRLTAALVAEEAAPVALLAACKHPLAAGGMAPGRFRAMVRKMEIALLRGPRPTAGFTGLRAAATKFPALDDFIGRLKDMASPFAGAMLAHSWPLDDLARRHVAFAEALATSDDTSGADRLWAGEAGEAAADFIAELLACSDVIDAIEGPSWPALLDSLMAGRVVRPHRGGHPRLSIWGPLEARLQQADLLILGGLNEGTWPPEAPPDPWMSRPMRTAFGLPLPERRIGLSAHDFAQAFCAAEVVLTRAARVEGTPTVPSRWLQRLTTLLGPEAATLAGMAEPLAWQAALDAAPGDPRPLPPPSPCPPVEARPRQLSVTQIETWMRDPYALYARHVLGLRALDPLDADPGIAEYGQFIHKALERFLKLYPDGPAPDSMEKLEEIGREVFGETLAQPGIWAFWWPRFRRIARWFLETETARRPSLRAVHAELSGTMLFDGPKGPFTLTARADRIDETTDGALVLIDYKTGQPPKKGDIELGFSPQLPLEAAMAREGGFAGVAPAAIEALVYWRLTGGDPPGEERPIAADAGALADEAVAGLKALIAHFDDPATPYRAQPRPDKAPRYGDYAHLARIREWSASAGDGEGGE